MELVVIRPPPRPLGSGRSVTPPRGSGQPRRGGVRPWSDSESLAVADAERRRASEEEGEVTDVETGDDLRVQGLGEGVARGREPEVARQTEQQECMPVVKTEHEVLVQALHEVVVCAQETTSEEVDVLAAETEHLAVGTSVHSVVVAVGHAEHGLFNHRRRVAEETEASDAVDRGETAARDRDAREEVQAGRATELEGRGEHGRDGEGTSGGVAHVEELLHGVASEAGHGDAADRTAHWGRGESDVQTDLAQGGFDVGGQRRGEVETGAEGNHGLELHDVRAGPVQALAEEASHLRARGAAARDGAARSGAAARRSLAAARGLAASRGLAAARGRLAAARGLAASRGLAAATGRLATSRGLAATGRRLAPLGGRLALRRLATGGRLAAAGGRLAPRGAARRRLAARGRATSGDLSSGHVLHFPFCCSTPLRAHGIHDNEFLKSHRRRLNPLHRLPVYEENEAVCCRI